MAKRNVKVKEQEAEQPKLEQPAQEAEQPKPEQPTQEAEQPKSEQPTQAEETSLHRYKIECCNQINESFGGVSFQNGVAYTDSCFTASWFRNKVGYTVSEVQRE